MSQVLNSKCIQDVNKRRDVKLNTISKNDKLSSELSF